MRRLIQRVKSERGASAVLFGLLLIPLLGFGGIAVDVGALYAEKAELQNGADAGALLVASACVKNELTCSGVSPEGIAGMNDSSDGVAAIQSVDLNTIDNIVTVTTMTEGLGVRHPLASMVLGPTDDGATVVHAEGTAVWGAPIAGSVIGLAFSYCEFEAYVPTEATPESPRVLIRFDMAARKDCPGTTMPGGFGWLDDTTAPTDDCMVDITVDESVDVGSDPGKSPDGECVDLLADRLLNDPVIYIPIYGEFGSTAGGAGGVWPITRFAAFHLTGYVFPTSKKSEDPLAPKCKGTCAGLQGYFLRYVDFDEFDEIGDGPDTGLYKVELVE